MYIPVARRTRRLWWSAARRSRGHEQGIALVITLFVVALVAVLVLEYHFDASVELSLAANYANDVQAYHLALAGVRFAQALLQRANANSDGPESEWYKLGLVPACFAPQQLLDLAAIVGGESLGAGGLEAQGSVFTNSQREDTRGGDAGCISLRMTDEDSKLPINALIPPNAPAGVVNPQDPIWVKIFQTFFESFKIEQPEEVVNALLDWMDPDDTPRTPGGAERTYYERLPVPYKPPDGPMHTPGDLRLVKGLDNPAELAKLFPGVPPEAMADIDLGSNAYVTTFGPVQPPGAGTPPQAKVNLNTATPEVLTALIAGAQTISLRDAASKVQDIVARRQANSAAGKQFSSANEATQGMNVGQAQSYMDVKSTSFRVESVGVVGDVRKKIVAVMQRPSSTALVTPSIPLRGPAPSPAPSPASGTQMTLLYFKVE